MRNYIGRRGTEADRINAVIEAYEATRDGKTADTVNRLVETMGRTGAAVAVASVVNAVSLHDGRISDYVRTWAQGVEGAPSNEDLRTVGIYGVDSWMHSAHVDNLGAAMRRWLRDNPPTEPETVEEEPTTSDALTVEALNEYEAKHGSRAAADLLALVPADRFAGDHAEALNRLEDRATRREEAEERQRQTDEENRRHCESIASALDDIASGRLYICPECGEWTEAEEDADGEIRCAHCGEIIDPDNCEQVTMYDYFNDCFDIEYTINSEGEYKGVRVMITCGGPNIYVDTVRGSVNLYWWTDTASAPLWSDTIEAIDQDFEELYTCTR